MSINKRHQSFKHAFNGLKFAVQQEANMKIHLVASLVVMIIGVCLEISLTEWNIIIVCVGFVIAMEVVNTALERICDLISMERRESIKQIKDMAAGAVLISVIAALIVASIIFISKAIQLI